MVRLYRSVDAFAMPTRGEGWGLPIIQVFDWARFFYIVVRCKCMILRVTAFFVSFSLACVVPLSNPPPPPHPQAMSMALPAIATNWSGNVDFMRSDNSMLLDVDRIEKLPAGMARHTHASPASRIPPPTTHRLPVWIKRGQILGAAEHDAPAAADAPTRRQARGGTCHRGTCTRVRRRQLLRRSDRRRR